VRVRPTWQSRLDLLGWRRYHRSEQLRVVMTSCVRSQVTERKKSSQNILPYELSGQLQSEADRTIRKS
jgi:hypothetical protein